jgi:hypothetical protein
MDLVLLAFQALSIIIYSNKIGNVRITYHGDTKEPLLSFTHVSADSFCF